MRNSIGNGRGIGGALRHALQGESFIRHIGNDKLIFDFHEGSGNTVYDKSHYGNDGTLTNPTDFTWKRNELSFGGNNGYITCEQNSSLDIWDVITLESWVKLDLPMNDNLPGIISKIDYANKDGWVMQTRQVNDKWQFIICISNTYHIAYTTVKWDKNYHHVVMNYDNETLRIYIDGRLEDKNVTPSGDIDSTSDDLFIGKSSTYYYKGLMRAIRITHKAFSQLEIQQNYLANKFAGNN